MNVWSAANGISATICRVSDDLTGTPQGEFAYAPERPMAGPPPAPVVPARPPGAAGWPWYFSMIAFFGGFVASQVVVVILLVLWIAVTGDSSEQISDNSTFTLVASAMNECVFVASAWIVALMSGGASLRDFGLVRTKTGQTILRAVAVMAAYLVMLGIYNALVHLAPDDAPDKLGAATSATHMFFFAILVAVLAPFAEEFFFRGMIFRSLANGTGVAIAAIVSGLLFGAMHIDSLSQDRLLQVIPLAIFGVLLALLYVWSGTLFANIAVHATNNALAVLAFASKNNSDFGMILAGVIWVGMMIFCFTGYRLTDRGGDPPQWTNSSNDAGAVGYAPPK
jgi:membrane protease YdiL (CAAX protease family)